MVNLYSENTIEISKLVFENVRNTVVCASIALAGVAVKKYPAMSFFGADAAPYVSLVLICVASLLVMWNALLGFTQFFKLKPTKSFWVFVTAYMPALFLQFFVVMGIFTGFVGFQVRG